APPPTIDRSQAAGTIRDLIRARAFRFLARDGRAAGKYCRLFLPASIVSSGRCAGRTGLHHYGCRRDDARKRSFCRKLRGVSLEQTTAAKRRPALERRKSVVPRGGYGAELFGKQFPVYRQALSANGNRNQFCSRVRNEREGRSRMGQFFFAHLQRTLAGGRARILQPV